MIIVYRWIILKEMTNRLGGFIVETERGGRKRKKKKDDGVLSISSTKRIKSCFELMMERVVNPEKV